jgi:tRNA A-37 threonylcarbamoyl transferase component Bud32
MPAVTGEYDVFVSVPMASIAADDSYKQTRADALRIVECLENECGLKAFYAGRQADNEDAFDAPDFAVVRDIQVLRQTRYFLMIYPEKLASSVLVEAGVALALGKKSVYFVRDVRDLPFVLRHLDRVYPTKIYEYKAADRILRMLREHKARLFEPWHSAEPRAARDAMDDMATADAAATAGPTRGDAPGSFREGEFIGPYTLVRRLGRGQIGVVWLAERRSSLASVRVALKFPAVTDADLEAIKREAQVWVQASGHPNILPVIEAEIYDGHVVIVSEYAPDGALDAWLRSHGGRAPSPYAAAAMALGILEGLGHLHARGLVHRDLKPANVLLQQSAPRIADFGLARVMQAADQTFSVAGTPLYMAPEAWDGDRSARADLWAVGVMLYEMIAGARPFVEPDVTQLRRSVRLLEPPPLPPATPQHLVEVVRRALRKDPAERYASADEMIRELRQDVPAPLDMSAASP